jgi:4-alpha-glucanotransferase
MNLPGTSSGNWTWRMRWESLTPEIEQRLQGLTETYERAK